MGYSRSTYPPRPGDAPIVPLASSSRSTKSSCGQPDTGWPMR